MVTRGQFLERPTLIPVRGAVLEALSHRGHRKPPLLIVPPTPGEGSMDHVVAAEVAWAAAMAGFPTLRFNFAGVGASQKHPDGTAHLVDDVQSALGLLHENTGVERSAVLAIGSSAKVAMALAMSCLTQLAGLALICPTGLRASELRERLPPVLLLLAQRDASAEVEKDLRGEGVAEAGPIEWELFPDVDATFSRQLPQVGRRVARWLEWLEGRSR